MSKILILANHYNTLRIFRRELIIRLAQDGHEILLAIPECEAEYKKVLEDYGTTVQFIEMERRGMNPIKDIKLIETYKKTEAVDTLKKYLCEKRNIKFNNIPYNSGNEVEFLEIVKQAFRRVHIFINSDTEKDAETIMEKFYAWRFKQSEIIRRN